MARFITSLLVIVAAVLGAGLGLWVGSPAATESPASGAAPAASGHNHDGAAAAESSSWTCSMHPQVQLPEPGQCPICGMDLIPVEGGQGGVQVSLSAEAKELARIRTVKVERRNVDVAVDIVGRVSWDETRVASITAWLGGRIERLFVDYTGTRVHKGDHLFELYSPELLAAQGELLAAARHAGRLSALGSDEALESAEGALGAAREKLRLWGLHSWQIRRILQRGKTQKTVTIYAPIGGTVIQKAALQGSYVKVGTPIYTIADLSAVWVVLDARETDLPWIRYGQSVSFETPAWPGRTFEGTVSFIAPTLDPRTRTVQVRVNVPNAGEDLKPEMYVRARLRAPAGGGGPSVEALRGKWVSPMHPEVVADEAGRCDVCGMKLVPAEEHWLVGPQLREGTAAAAPPLVIPATAPILTGRRAVVFVEIEGADEPTYMLREITLGARAGEWLVVRDGLMEGERIVSEGAFKLDSALQIRGSTSSMSLPPPAEDSAAGHVHAPPPPADPEPGSPAFAAALDTVTTRAVTLSAALAADDLEGSRAAAGPLAEAWHAAAAEMEPDSKLDEAAAALAKATDLDGFRVALAPFMDGLSPLIRANQAALKTRWQLTFCPMARDDAGALWLQAPGDVANPYFGAAMLRCGEARDSSVSEDSP